MSWYLFRKKNKCRRKTINRVQFDDDFIIKVFEHSRSVFQIMVFINGSIAAVIFAKDFSLYREMIGVIFSGIILSFILKSLSIGALFGYARSERNDSFTRTLSMFLETLSVIVLSVSLAFSIQFYPYKNHIVVKLLLRILQLLILRIYILKNHVLSSFHLIYEMLNKCLS